MILIGFLLIALSSIADAVRDTLAHAFDRSKFSNLSADFWNPARSGRNKWKNGDREEGERFFLSSTLLVSLTEAWHLFKTLHVFALFLGCFILGYLSSSFWNLILMGVLARIVFGLVFTVAYRYFKNGK